jgi:hypothetical protein
VFGRWMADGVVMHNFIFDHKRNAVIYFNQALAVGDRLLGN